MLIGVAEGLLERREKQPVLEKKDPLRRGFGL